MRDYDELTTELEAAKKKVGGLSLAFKVTGNMISDFQNKLADAVSNENWSRAAELQSYISGMQQIQTVFEQTVSGDPS